MLCLSFPSSTYSSCDLDRRTYGRNFFMTGNLQKHPQFPHSHISYVWIAYGDRVQGQRVHFPFLPPGIQSTLEKCFSLGWGGIRCVREIYFLILQHHGGPSFGSSCKMIVQGVESDTIIQCSP